MSWHGKGEPPALRGGLLKICAGVVEEARGEPYRSAIDKAQQAVAKRCCDMTPQQRLALGRAIELNLINRKRHPVELLCYTHELPIGKKRFYLARRLFCEALLEQLHLTGSSGAGPSEEDAPGISRGNGHACPATGLSKRP